MWFVGGSREKALISVHTCGLNEGENILVSCYFNKKHTVGHLSFSLLSHFISKCDPPSPIICGLLCCFFPPHLQMLSLDVSVKWKWVDKRERGIFFAFIVPLKSLLIQHSACKAYSWKTIIKGVNRERNYMWCRHWAKTANACPTSKQHVLTRCGSQNLRRHSNFYGKNNFIKTVSNSAEGCSHKKKWWRKLCAPL